MKIIDLYTKIANGEKIPRKFTYKGYLWEYDIKSEMWFYYFGEGKCHRFDRLFYLHKCLNDEVKIIEEDKEIKKLNLDKERETIGNEQIRAIDYLLEAKINKLIDKVNNMEEIKNENNRFV